VGILLLGFEGWQGWFFWVVLLTVLGLDHPPTIDLVSPLDRRRKLYAWSTVGLFVLTFMPVPIRLADELELPSGEVTHISYHQTQAAPVRPFTFVYRP